MLLSIEIKRLGSLFHIPRDQVMWYDVFGWSEGRRMVGQSDDRTAHPGCCLLLDQVAMILVRTYCLQIV